MVGYGRRQLRDGTNTPREKAQHFRPAQQADVDWATKLKRIRLDYHGEEVKVPQCITWIEPALPNHGQVRRLRATDLCEGWLGEVMRDPHKALLPRDQLPADLPAAKVWVESNTEWKNIVRYCAERQLWGFITPDKWVWHNEQPLLVGAFGVPKPERKVSKTGSPVLRLIMNAIPVDAVQSLFHGVIRSLPYHGQHFTRESELTTLRGRSGFVFGQRDDIGDATSSGGNNSRQ